MKTLSRLAPAFMALALAFSGAGLAQKASPTDPARIAAAKELLEVAGSAKQFDAVMPMMTRQMEQIFVQMAPRHAKEIREIFGTMMERFASRKQEMLDQIAAVYAERFEAAEMAEIARFFKSGVGARFVAMQPEIAQQSMLIGQRWGERIGREIESEVRRELKKRGIDI